MTSESTTVTFRLPLEEHRALEREAHTARESISEYVRKAVALRVGGGTPVRLPSNTSTAALYAQAEIRPLHMETTAGPSEVVVEEYVHQL